MSRSPNPESVCLPAGEVPDGASPAGASERLPLRSALGLELRNTADAFEQAQRLRIQAGERIRAVLQGHDFPGAAPDHARDPDDVLKQILAGNTDGPMPTLGRCYRGFWRQEREVSSAMSSLVVEHPAWLWLEHVRGVGAHLAGKLLGHLDITRARTPSAFWAYCGLATVPGKEFTCAQCGYQVAYPPSYRPAAQHNRLNSRALCSGALVQTGRPTDGVRVAQPYGIEGHPLYNRRAKTVCYLIGVSMLRVGGSYAEYCREQRRLIDDTRPQWPAKRRHHAALRKTEKLFLAHLWAAWAELVGMDPVRSYASDRLRHPWHDPWSMVEPKRGAVVARPASLCPSDPSP